MHTNVNNLEEYLSYLDSCLLFSLFLRCYSARSTTTAHRVPQQLTTSVDILPVSTLKLTVLPGVDMPHFSWPYNYLDFYWCLVILFLPILPRKYETCEINNAASLLHLFSPYYLSTANPLLQPQNQHRTRVTAAGIAWCTGKVTQCVCVCVCDFVEGCICLKFSVFITCCNIMSIHFNTSFLLK